MIGTATHTGHPDDLVDDLIARCGGEVLAPAGKRAGGEYDLLTDGHVTRTDMRRLVASGLVSPHGVPADVLADRFGWQGDAGSFVDHYVSTSLAGLAARRERRQGDSWVDQVRPDEDEEPAESMTGTVRDLTGPCLDYLSRLVYGPKRDYASCYAMAVCGHCPMPDDPGTEWAGKARRKVDHYLNGGAA